MLIGTRITGPRSHVGAVAVGVATHVKANWRSGSQGALNHRQKVRLPQALRFRHANTSSHLHDKGFWAVAIPGRIVRPVKRRVVLADSQLEYVTISLPGDGPVRAR